jgi:phosphoadenosine phosphosulfate reductase
VPAQLQERVARVEALLRQAALDYAPSTLASSLGAEDMVLADAILRARLPIEIFTLDTGRLHAETLALVDRVQERYGYSIKLYRPDKKAVAGYVNEFGLDGSTTALSCTRCRHIRSRL